jgi:hypothetical protein
MFQKSVQELLVFAFAILSGAKRLRQRSEIKNFASPRSVQDAKNPINGFFLKKKRAEARRKGGFKNLSP